MKKVLDKGFVRLVDWCGDDSRIVDAARVSISGEGVKAVTRDEALIRYLMRHRHTTPFEMVDFTFHIKCPIFVARQWMRHRTFSYNEMSGRYSELPREWYTPEEKRIVLQSKTNNQGSDSEILENAKEHSDDFSNEAYDAFDSYELRLKDGMTREIARVNLPVSTYTEFFVKGNLHNWMHFLGLRMHSHAQHEIRVYADAIAEFIKEECPLAWQAFEDYRLNSLFLTGYDVAALQSELTGDGRWNEDDFPTKREYKEFLVKREKLTLQK